MFGVGLHNPKNPINVGHVLRAAHAYGAAAVATTGKRIPKGLSNVSGAQRHLPVFKGDDLRDFIPHGCVPVAVELVPEAISLVDFEHPREAFYVFGAEDATLGSKVLSWCKHIVYIPTTICMNLAACVNVVLYDRLAKEARRR